MKICTKCNEELPPESFKGNHKSCSNCSGTPTKMVMDAKNFKWKVAIQEHTVDGDTHSYVPVNGKCTLCKPQNAPKSVSKRCERCRVALTSIKRRFCSNECVYLFKNKLRGHECLHCEDPMPRYQTRFCSLKCTEDYKANINRISKL